MVPQEAGRVVAALVLAAGALVLAGCSSAQEPEVARVAATFEDPAGDPGGAATSSLPPPWPPSSRRSAPCTEAIEELPLEGGEVESVEVWGGNAQVALAGDTVFLAETGAGWRVTAAACRPQAEAPYDCEVDGP